MTGLYVCGKGQYSINGQAPCSDCPRGTVSEQFASTECMSCPQGFYANPASANLEPNSVCLQCPLTADGPTSTLQVNSLFQDCQRCDVLFELTPKAIPFCERDIRSLNGTTPPITTTPEPAVCGDGRRAPSEGCDDGNGRDRDGCSSTCRIERYWKCSRPVRILDYCFPLLE